MSHHRQLLDLNGRDLAPGSLLESHRLIAELVEAYSQAALLAYTDSLTKLMNRHAIVDWIDREIRIGFTQDPSHTPRRSDHGTKSLAVVAIDLVKFKGVNDTLGHAAGDAALIHTARAIRRAVRLTDIVGRGRKDVMAARRGGDEFIVALRNTDADGAKIAIDRILNSIRQFGHGLDARAGCVVWERPTHVIGETLLDAADMNERKLHQRGDRGALITLYHR